MPHALVLALFTDRAPATVAARALREFGLDRGDLSVVSRTHEEEGALAAQVGGSPGAEMEDSRAAARLGELGAQILAAIALVLPGVGPIVGAGPLSAELGEAAGHAVGGIASVLERAGFPPDRAAAWQVRVQDGAVLLGVHVRRVDVDVMNVKAALEGSGAIEVVLAQWE
jgi:hypothetical protein